MLSPMLLAFAVAVFAASTLGLFLLVEPIPSWYYHLAWWSYIVGLDEVNRRLSGRSLLSRPARLLWLAGVSVAWWTLFEAMNLRLGNWYYVMDDPRRWVRWAGGIAAFATVLPGIVVTLTFIEDRGWLRTVRVPALSWSAARDRACWVLGLAGFAVPLLWPRYFFALTWTWAALLIEPWNRRHASRSYLRNLEHGQAGPLCQTLAAGLVCGLLWETWNFWARTKWIYTVPFFDRFKLFEMPVLGMVGFAPFAVQCLALVRFLQALGERRRPTLALGATAWTAAVGFTAVVFAAGEGVTVDSYYVPVRELRVLEPGTRERLAALGLASPEKLARALDAAEDRGRWEERSGLTLQELERAQAAVRLVLRHGLGERRALELRTLGIRTVDELRRWRAEDLAAALCANDPRPSARFLERRARVWVGG